jgi:hypothetical protein
MNSSVFGSLLSQRPVRFGSVLLLLACLFIAGISSGHAQDSPSGLIPGTISIVAGNGLSYVGNTPTGVLATSTPLSNYVHSFAVDSKGNIYLSTVQISGNVAMYMIYGGQTPVPPVLAAVVSGTPQVGYIYQLTYNASCTSGTCGDGSTLDKASFNTIVSMSFDSSDNLYVSDGGAFVIRKVAYATGIVTTVAGQPFNESNGSYDLSQPVQATGTPLNCPQDAKTDSAGNLYIADACDNVVRVVYNVNNLTTGVQVPPLLSLAGFSSPPQQGYIYTLAGAPGGTSGQYCQSDGSCGDGSSMANALFGGIVSIDIDSAGNLYVLDNGDVGGIDPAVRLINAGTTDGKAPPLLSTVSLPSGQTAPQPGYIYSIAGSAATCSQGPCGDGGLALKAQLNNPIYLRIDSTGNVYIADFGDNIVRKVDEAGYISSVAGAEAPNVASRASTGSGGAATSAVLYQPYPIAFDAQSDLYLLTEVGGTTGRLLWEVTPATPQTIDFPALATPVTYGVSPVTLEATASSGLDVYFAVTGPASVVCPNSASLTPNSSNTAYTCAGNSANAQLKITGAGTVTVTASQPGGTVTAESSTIVYAPATAASGTSLAQTITVGEAPLTVTANSFSVTYGQFNPTVTGFYSASYSLVNNDTAATALTGQPSFSTTPTVTASSPQGTYTIGVSQGSLASANYDIADATYVSGTLTITGSTPQTVIFQLPSSVANGTTYGLVTTVPLSATASSGGPVTFAITNGGPGTISGSTLKITGAGTIQITATQAGYEQYESATASQTITIAPASLTVTAPSPTYSYGTNIMTALTSASPNVTGWVGSDTSSLVSGSPAYTTSATSTSAPGTYTLAVAQGSLTLAASIAANYTFKTFVPGTVTIAKASQTITFALAYTFPSDPVIFYGTGVTLTAKASSGLPVTLTLTGPGVLGSSTGLFGSGGSVFVTNPSSGMAAYGATGTGPITITASQAGNADYSAAPSVIQSQTVKPSTLTVTANSYSREYGAANPNFIYGIGPNLAAGIYGEGFQNGDSDIPSVLTGLPTLTTTATSSSPPGTYPIVVTQGTLAALPLSSPNYAFQFVNGTLTVLPPGAYTMTTNPSSLTIQRGQSAQSTVTITPSNLYQGTVTLNCGQLPANVSCTISPATYTFPGNQTGGNPSENPALGTITINTTAATVVGALPVEKSNLRLAGLLIPGALGGLFLLFARKRAAKAAALWGLCVLLALSLGTLAITSCGGSGGLTTAAPGTVTVTITGTGTTPSGSGTVTASVPLTVTIQ